MHKNQGHDQINLTLVSIQKICSENSLKTSKMFRNTLNFLNLRSFLNKKSPLLNISIRSETQFFSGIQSLLVIQLLIYTYSELVVISLKLNEQKLI